MVTGLVVVVMVLPAMLTAPFVGELPPPWRALIYRVEIPALLAPELLMVATLSVTSPPLEPP
jgi:hypothetical protein